MSTLTSAARLSTASSFCSDACVVSSLPAGICWFSVDSLLPLLFGLEAWDFRGGLLISTFSWTLLAELSVGRIIRARKSPPAGFALFVLAVLVRGFGFWLALDCAGRDVRAGFARADAAEVEIVEGRERREGLVALAWLARLGERDEGALAAEAAVAAVADEGSRTGRVGDLARGLVACPWWWFTLLVDV